MNAILQTVAKLFPSVNLGQAVDKAQEAMNGVPDTLEGVSQAAARMGINRTFVENIYSRYGTTAQAKAICRMLGTTPEALKADAEKIVGGGGSASIPAARSAEVPQSGANTKKFPRLK